MKINELESLDLPKLHLHCITVEYINVVPAMLLGFSEISIYAYEGGEIAIHGVKRKAITQAVVTATRCITVGCGCTWFRAVLKGLLSAKEQIWLLVLIRLA